MYVETPHSARARDCRSDVRSLLEHHQLRLDGIMRERRGWISIVAELAKGIGPVLGIVEQANDRGGRFIQIAAAQVEFD